MSCQLARIISSPDKYMILVLFVAFTATNNNHFVVLLHTGNPVTHCALSGKFHGLLTQNKHFLNDNDPFNLWKGYSGQGELVV